MTLRYILKVRVKLLQEKHLDFCFKYSTTIFNFRININLSFNSFKVTFTYIFVWLYKENVLNILLKEGFNQFCDFFDSLQLET